jgi:hypothetical protein
MQSTSTSKLIKGTRLLVAAALFIVLASASSHVAAAKAVLDFDGDGKTDYAVTHYLREADIKIEWYVLQSSGGVIAQQFGLSNYGTGGIYDLTIPEDYDGDGKCDIAVFRRGEPLMLYVLASQTNTFQATAFSGYQNLFMTQDFDGDGKADPTEAYRAPDSLNLIWRILESRTGNLRTVHFGNYYTDRTIKGDFDGDGKADIAVYRNNTGAPANTYFVLRSSDGAVVAATFGNSIGDYNISGDFDGDGKTDFAVRRSFGASTDGNWYWLESSTGAFRSLAFGLSSDQAAPGDYDGDGKTDQAVMRFENGDSIFYVNQSAGGMSVTHWGHDAFPLAGLYTQYGP